MIRQLVRDSSDDFIVLDFLTRQGRGKFVRPLYHALTEQGEWGQAHARAIYARARAGYHPIVQGGVDRIVTPEAP